MHDAGRSVLLHTRMHACVRACVGTHTEFIHVYLTGEAERAQVGGLREESQGGGKEKEVTLDDVWEAAVQCGQDGRVELGAWRCWQGPTASCWHDDGDEDEDEDEEDDQ